MTQEKCYAKFCPYCGAQNLDHTKMHPVCQTCGAIFRVSYEGQTDEPLYNRTWIPWGIYSPTTNPYCGPTITYNHGPPFITGMNVTNL